MANSMVIGVDGAINVPSTTLASLTDTNVPAPNTNDVLQWSGAQWIAAAITAGGGATVLNDLTNVSGTPTTNQVLTYNGSSWAPADTQGAGGAGGIQDHLDVYGNTNQSIDAGWTDVSWGVQRVESGAFTFTAPSVEVTIVDSSTYLVQASITTQGLAGTSRSEAAVDIQIDTGAGYVTVPGSTKFIYCRQATEGKGTASVQFIWTATAGHKIKVRAQRSSGTTTMSTIGNGCQFTLIKLTGEKGDVGDTGPTGPAGAGASTLNELTDVVLGTPTTGDHLEYNGTNWIATAPAGGGGVTELDDLTDVNLTTTAPAEGNHLIFDSVSGTWLPQDIHDHMLMSSITAQSGTGSIPHDNSTPLVSEGTQIWSGVFALHKMNNHVVFEFSSVMGVNSGNDETTVIIAVFRDSVCIGASAANFNTKDNAIGFVPVSFNITDMPMNTSNHTYSIRIGTTGGTWYIGRTTSATLGGAIASGSSVHISEMRAE